MEAAAQYKKQDGVVSVSTDGKIVSWKSATGAIPPLAIAIADIGNLQQTPVTSAKASIKIVVQEGLPQAGNHTLTFTSATARDDQQATTGLLRKWIETSKAQSIAPPAPVAEAATTRDGGGASASMAMAQTVTASANDNTEAYDDAKLLANLELQMSLLGADPTLRQRFDRALNDKPDSVTLGAFSNQFWSTRVHLLRSHATALSQASGRYNVLSVIKPQNVDGKMVLNMTKEQIELIFRQHPVVRKAYNDNVPPMSEGIFWERFFNSRLRQKIRGEDIKENVPVDAKLDPYLTYNERADNQDLLASSIPNFINIEANESNHSQKQGNQPDWTMKPGYYEKQKTPGIYQKVPVLQILNRMSEKLMQDVPPSDASRHGPVGLDEETYKELQLRDLQRASDDNRVVLMVQDQNRFFSAGQSVHTSTNAADYTKRAPKQVLSTLQHDLRNFGITSSTAPNVNLHATIAVDDDSDSDDEDSSHKKAKVGSKASRNAAATQIMSSVKKRHLHDDEDSSKDATTSQLAVRVRLPENILDNLIMTHNTTVEFLHYFWTVFHSGDPDRANEVAKLIETLDRSLDRIKAVADMAEADRATKVEKARESVELFNARSARKKKFDPASVQGGAKVVNQIAEPLFQAINAARSQYQRTLQEQLGSTMSVSGT